MYVYRTTLILCLLCTTLTATAQTVPVRLPATTEPQMVMPHTGERVILMEEETDEPYFGRLSASGRPTTGCWDWQFLPDGVMFPAYLAGGRESRMASQWFYEPKLGWNWDLTVGGRVPIVRYGTAGSIMPEGWQLDLEGAAFPRLELDYHRNMQGTDFRFGLPLTYRSGPWETKLAWYHISSHLGDEYMQANMTLDRINYSRDAIVLAAAYRPFSALRLYAEAGWAFYTDGGSEPWEFQFGVDYSTPMPTGIDGSPFAAINGRIREEVDFGGNFTVQAGWQWRSYSGRLMRLGGYYFNGMSDQYQFFRRFEQQGGMGIWYDY